MNFIEKGSQDVYPPSDIRLVAPKGERQPCNIVPVEMVLWYLVERKVSALATP